MQLPFTGGIIVANHHVRALLASTLAAIIASPFARAELSQLSSAQALAPTQKAVSSDTPVRQQSRYSLTLIGSTYPNDPTRQFGVSDISDRGDVTGTRMGADGRTIAFIWRDNVFRDLNDVLSAQDATVAAINDSLDVAGNLDDAQSQRYTYVLSGTGTLTTLVPPQGQRISGVRDLNNSRQALLDMFDDVTGFQNAVWQDGLFSQLERLPDSARTAAVRINDLGVVLGTADDATGTGSRAVLWQNDTIMPLPQPEGSTFVTGIDISNGGVVVMDAIFPAAPAHRSVVVWQEGQLSVLRPVRGLSSARPVDVSNRDVIVGISSQDVLGAGPTATLWRGRAGIPVDLNARVLSDDPLKEFVHLQIGLLISDGGYIVARGEDSRDTDGRRSFYLLTPR